MDNILNIVLSTGGVVLGSVLTTFKDEILNLFGTRMYKGLKGNWSCTWSENVSGAQPVIITDTVTVKNVRGRLISGEGNTQGKGNWTFKGEISDNTITLTYKFNKLKIVNNAGVIILKLGDNPTIEMDGVWSQYKSGELKGGSTTWKKTN